MKDLVDYFDTPLGERLNDLTDPLLEDEEIDDDDTEDILDYFGIPKEFLESLMREESSAAF
jgi:hypothetical protein